MFFGYAQHSKAYKLIDKETGTVVDFHDVIFDETSVVNHTSGSQTDYIWFAEESQKSENEQLLSLDVQEDVPEQIVHE